MIVQSFNPQHYAIRMAAGYDHEAFWTKELAMREELGYPPYRSLCRVVLSGTNEEGVRDAAERLGKKLGKALDIALAEVLGPAPAPLTRLKGRYRMHLLIKTDELERVVPILKRLVLNASKGRVIQASLDVDPLSIL